MSIPRAKLFNRDFLLLWQGQAVSQLGSQATAIAAAFWLYETTRSGSLMGLVTMAATLPVVFLGPIGGTVADRVSRKKLIVFADFLSGLAMLAMGLALFSGRLPTQTLVGMFFGVSILVGILRAFFMPALQAAIPDLVPPDKLQGANAFNQMTIQGSLLVGQGVGGVLFRLIGAPWLFAINSITFMTSSLLTAFIRLPEHRTEPAAQEAEGGTRRGFRADFLGGLAYLKARRGLLGFFIAASSFNFFTAPVAILVPFYVGDVLKATPDWGGFLIAAFSFGSILGFIVFGALRFTGRARGRFVVTMMLLSPLPLMVIGFVTAKALALLLAGAMGVVVAGINVYIATTLQATTPPEMRGRVMGMLGTLASGLVPLGSLLGGVLTDLTNQNIGLVFLISGAACFVLTLLLAVRPAVLEFLSYTEPERPVPGAGEPVPGEAPGGHAEAVAVPAAASSGFQPQGRRRRGVGRVIWRAFQVGAVLVLVLVVGFAVWAYRRAGRALPQVEGEARVAGLEGEVTVHRDAAGVPHLTAANERDLFFAQGYVHAQDRLWQMHFNRTLASGRLTSLFGPGPRPADEYLLTVGLRRLAELDLEHLSPDTRALLEAYSAGVNAFLESHGDALPFEFVVLRVEPEPWTPVDSLVWARMLGFNLSLNGQLEVARQALVEKLGPEMAKKLVPPYPADAPTILSDPALPPPAAVEGTPLAAFVPAALDAARVGGSNAWVVAGSRTASGRPLLANDTHLGLGMPSVWYQMSLTGGRFAVSGFSLPGLPFVFIGQNGHVAWGITNLNADVQDLYLEKLDDPAKPTRYLFRGEWRPLTVRREEIAVKGRPPEPFTVLSTHHGPLITGRLPSLPPDAPPMSFAWAAAAGPNRLLDGVSALDRAAGAAEVRAALALWDSPSLNVVYADTAGNIGYQATARVPLRAPGHDGTVPVSGESGEHEWQGFIPFEEMPHAENPASGSIATANHKVVPDSYPHLLTHDWPPPDRARRIEAMLAGRSGLTVDDMKRMQLDTFYEPVKHDQPILVAAIKPETDLEKQALAALAAWNGRFDVDEIGPAVYQAWGRFLGAEIFDEFDPDLTQRAGPLVFSQSEMLRDLFDRPDDPLFDDRRTKGVVETRDDILRRTFPMAVEWLSQRFGPDPERWKWGRIHYSALLHQPLGPIPVVGNLFSGGRFDLPGDAGTVNSIASDGERQPFRAVFGVSQRFIADFSDLGRSLAVNSTGACAHLRCPDRDAETIRWARGEYHGVTPEAGGKGKVLVLKPAAKGGR